MRFLTADYLYSIHVKPIKEGVLQISETGKVFSIIEDRSSVPKGMLKVFYAQDL